MTQSPTEPSYWKWLNRGFVSVPRHIWNLLKLIDYVVLELALTMILAIGCPVAAVGTGRPSIMLGYIAAFFLLTHALWTMEYKSPGG